MRESASSPQVERSSVLSDQVASILRDMVLSQQIKPGQRIVQTEWAQRLGVSRMPVRDAISRLCAEGVLTVGNQAGTAIAAEVSIDDLKDGYALSADVASVVTQRAVQRITDEEMAHLESLHRDMITAVERDDRAHASKLSHDFHRAINVAAKSARLMAFVRLASISIPHSTYELEEWPQRGIADHEMILLAFRSRNHRLAADLMRHHVEAGSKLMLSRIERQMAGDDASAP